jgi:hypothetical protein
MKYSITALILTVLLFANGCASPEQKAKERRDKLLAANPPGRTTRADILVKWNYDKPQITEFRPTAGWEKCRDPKIGWHCTTSERRTGKRIARCDRYISPSGLNSMVYTWYFYDSYDKLVDIEWEQAN